MQAKKTANKKSRKNRLKRGETTTRQRTTPAHAHPHAEADDLRVVAGAHALLLSLAAAVLLVVVLAGAAFRSVLRSVRGGLRSVRVERGENPHVALPSAAAAAIVVVAARLPKPELLPAGEQRHRRREVHEM